MKRRSFIKNTIPVAFLPALLQGQNVSAYGPDNMLSRLAASFVDSDHVLVLVQLNGGNDGLNTVIPLDQYSNLSKARSNILIQDTKVLALNGTTATGLHPSMTGMQKLYNDGKLTIMQAVGYPTPNYSHFRATDIWNTASDSNQLLSSGWVGRYLSEEYPNFPSGYPNTNMPDPLAIQVGSLVSTALQGLQVSMGMAITDPANFYQMINGTTDQTPNTHAGHELTYIRTVASQTTQYATAIKAAASKATNLSTLYPSKNSLADQLKIVAQLIAGGLKTRIYMVNLGGFDTHSLQVDTTDSSKGDHATLLDKLSSAIYAFMDDLKLLKVDDRVLGMTFSEFGRRIQSNFSGGTDHGAAAPLFLFGNKVKGGIVGTNPVIPATIAADDNVTMQTDFRQIYSTILSDWFCLQPADVKTVMIKDFNKQNIINGNCNNNAVAQDIRRNAGIALIKNWPNPFDSQTTIEFISEGGNVMIELYDIQGHLVRIITDQVYAPGTHQLIIQRDSLAAGTYYCKLQNGLSMHTRSMSVVN
jgi:uncharacterized protein (DUF1501 family)